MSAHTHIWVLIFKGLRTQPGFHPWMLVLESKALPRPTWRKLWTPNSETLFLFSALLKVHGILVLLRAQHSSWCSVSRHHLPGALELYVHCHPVKEALSCFSWMNGSSPRHPYIVHRTRKKARDVVAVETDNGTVILQLGAAHNMGCGRRQRAGEQKRCSYSYPISHISYPWTQWHPSCLLSQPFVWYPYLLPLPLLLLNSSEIWVKEDNFLWQVVIIEQFPKKKNSQSRKYHPLLPESWRIYKVANVSGHVSMEPLSESIIWIYVDTF